MPKETTASDHDSQGFVEPWTRAPAALAADLGTDVRRGLDDAEAGRRLARWGRNALPEPKEPLWKEALEPFREPMILLLLATLVLFFVVGELEDAFALFVIIAVVVAVEAVQERRAKKAIRALESMTEPAARVLRGGVVTEVRVDVVVPGDVLVLERGFRVAADARLAECVGLLADESALTGESVPVAKAAEGTLPPGSPLAERTNMAFTGTTVVAGRGRGIVVATGPNSELGKVRSLARGAEPGKTPLQKAIDGLAFRIAAVVLSICAAVVLVGVAQGRGLTDALLVGLSLAVVTIPEDLPILITVILVFGLLELSRRRAIVRDPYRGEVLGSVTVVCTDKTGTLTENRMQVTSLADLAGTWLPADAQKARTSRTVAEIAYRASEPSVADPESIGASDPLESALIAFGRSLGISESRAAPSFEIPFSERTRFRAIAFPQANGVRIFVKGAPEALLARSRYILTEDRAAPITQANLAALHQRAEEIAAGGLRVLALAYRDQDPPPDRTSPEGVVDLVFVGFAGIEDPPRPGVREAIRTCRTAGIRVVMVTGDHPRTASSIARQVGIDGPDRVLQGQDLDRFSPQEFEAATKGVNVFARITPEHKLRILRSLRTQGEVVAMTGDGVNDAPALREADVGVAMGETGTDVAREAASMVLADDNLATLVEGIRGGKRSFDNLQKAVTYYLPSKAGILATVAVPILLGLPSPLLPIQIILLEVLNDVTASTGYVTEPAEPDLMRRPPRPRDAGLFTAGMRRRIVVNTVGASVPLTAMYLYLLWLGVPLEEVRTTLWVALILVLGVMAFSVRTRGHRLWGVALRENRYLVLVVLATIVVVLAATYVRWFAMIFRTTPLPIDALAYASLAAIGALGIMELGKIRRESPREARGKRRACEPRDES